MSKRRTCKTCIHYRDIPKWESEKKSNDFTGHCTLYPPEFVKRDKKEEKKTSDTTVLLDTAVTTMPIAAAVKKSSDTKEALKDDTDILSLFRFTRKTDYCGQHTTQFREIIERFYPVIYVAVGSICTTIGAYILHILTKPE